MSQRFKGKTVLINGGSKGIGLSCCKLFLDEGANVAIASRSKTHIEEALEGIKKHNNSVFGIIADFCLESDVKNAFSSTIDRFNKCDILVNSAGVSKASKIEDITLDEWKYIIDNNLNNCFLGCKYAVKHMRKNKYGKIINVASIAGRFRSKFAGAHYSCSKAGIICLTRQLAAEVGGDGINVNAVCPSQTKTEMLLPFLKNGVEDDLIRSIPLSRLSSPEEQAHVILFLASEEASYMTGAIVDVNGGQF